MKLTEETKHRKAVEMEVKIWKKKKLKKHFFKVKTDELLNAFMIIQNRIHETILSLDKLE